MTMRPKSLLAFEKFPHPDTEIHLSVYSFAFQGGNAELHTDPFNRVVEMLRQSRELIFAYRETAPLSEESILKPNLFSVLLYCTIEVRLLRREILTGEFR